MDQMDVKIYGGIVSTALSLITGRTRATRLQIKPASISIGISGYLQRFLDGIINCKPGNYAWFNSNNTAALSLLTGDTIIKTNPVCADLTGNNISGNRFIKNFLASIQTRTSKHVHPNTSYLYILSQMFSVLPAKTVRIGTTML